jgi:DNA invertase Pin-like site-specific DNA recombinase
MHDRDSKGRWRKGSSENFRRGSAHYRAKLNELAIKEILRKLNLGETQKAIAKEFEISPQLVSGVKRGLYWKHVARPR